MAKPPTKVLLETHPAFLLHHLQFRPNCTSGPSGKDKQAVEPSGGREGRPSPRRGGVLVTREPRAAPRTGQCPCRSLHAGLGSFVQGSRTLPRVTRAAVAPRSGPPRQTRVRTGGQKRLRCGRTATGRPSRRSVFSCPQPLPHGSSPTGSVRAAGGAPTDRWRAAGRAGAPGSRACHLLS